MAVHQPQATRSSSRSPGTAPWWPHGTLNCPTKTSTPTMTHVVEHTHGTTDANLPLPHRGNSKGEEAPTPRPQKLQLVSPPNPRATEVALAPGYDIPAPRPPVAHPYLLPPRLKEHMPPNTPPTGSGYGHRARQSWQPTFAHTAPPTHPPSIWNRGIDGTH